MAEQHNGMPAGDRRSGRWRQYYYGFPSGTTIPLVFILLVAGALFLILGPSNSVLTLPTLRVVFNNPIQISAEATPPPPPPPPSPSPAASNVNGEYVGLPPPRQLSDPPYSLGRAIPDYDARRSAWLAAHP